MTLTRLIRAIHQESDRIDHDLIDEWRATLTRLLTDWNDAEIEAAINPLRGSPADQPRLDAEAADLKRDTLQLLE